MVLRSERRPNLDGIVPVNIFPDMSNSVRKVKRPSSDGRLPVNAFPPKSRQLRAIIRPSSGGTVPVRSLPSKLRKGRELIPDISDGKVRDSRFLLTSTNVRDISLRIPPGRVPDNSSSGKLKRCKFDKRDNSVGILSKNPDPLLLRALA